MASSWSRSLGIGNYGSQMKVTVQVLSQNRSGNTSRVKVTIQAYNGGVSRAYNQGSGAAVSVSGNGISHSAQVKFNISGRTWFTFADWQFTVSHNSDGTLPVNIVGRIADTGTSSLGNGGGVRVQGTADPLYLAPTAPSWGSTAYQDPGRVRVEWNNRATARGSYDRVRVQRWARSTGNWSHRALLSGSATSYTDTSLSSNNEHRWRVRAEGPGGTSGWVQGGTLGTTPAAATGVRAVKAEQGVRVSWTDNAAPTNRSRTFYVDDNPGGTGWVRVGSIGGSATSWTHTDADPAVTHQYRVWTRITSGIDHTSAASDPSAVLQLQAAPKQPRRVAPLDILTLEVGDTLPLEWKHNPVDTTEQTEAELQWRVEGGDWNTVQITGSQNTYEVTPNPSGARAQVEWRVRTRGAHPDWSPWSTTNGPLLSTRPMVLIQAPVHGEDLTTSRVDAAWTYEAGGTEPQLQQAEWVARLSLYDSGTEIENQSGSTASSAELQTRLQNGVRYALVITVRNGDGLWSSPDVAVFTTDFPLPAVVEAFPSWDQASGSVSVGFGESEELRASYRWTGEAGASTSEQYVDDPALAVELTDMIKNGDLADGQDYWTGDGDYGWAQVNGPPGEGFSAALTNVNSSYASGSVYTGGSMSVSAGQEYIFEVWVRASKAGSVSFIELRDQNGEHAVGTSSIESGGSGSTGSYLMGGYTMPTTWTLYRVRFTPTSGTEYARLASFYTNHTAGTVQDAKVWLTGFKLYPASAVDEGVVATNLVTAPSVENGPGFESVSRSEVTVEDGPDGLRGLLTTTEDGTAYVGFRQLQPGQNSWLAFGADIGWAEGIRRVRVQLQCYREDGSLISSPQVYWDRAEHPGPTGRAYIVERVPLGTVDLRVYTWFYADESGGSPVTGAQVWIDNYSVTTAPTQERAQYLAEHYFDGDTLGVTDVDAIDVERRQPDGSWLLIASGIDTSTTVTDRTPHIGDVQYRAISRTVLPTEQEGPPATAVWVHDRDPVFVNGGDGMDQLCLARGSEATDEHSVDQELHRFAGQQRPTAFFGPGQDYTTTFTGRILPHYHLPVSSRAEWVALLRQRGLVCFRDCTGRKLFGVLTVDFSQAGNVETVSISVQEADYTEGVRRVTDYELEQRQGE